MFDISDCLRAQDKINQACQKALKRKKPPHSLGKWQSLEDRLLDCYIESCEGAPKDKRFCHGVRLLEKIVLQDNLSTLVVNLYPGNEGYSLMLRGKNGTDSETVRLPYEESEFLEYLDAQELPPILVDLLERSQVNVFYSGCVIVEVRDYRQSAMANSYDSYYVLLQPTYQTLICDVNAMTSESSKWTQEDKLALEAQLLLATEGPLCLDPTPEVARVSNQLQFNYNKLNLPGLKRAVRKNSQAFRNRSTLMSLGQAPSNLKLLDFLSHYKKPQPPVNLRLAKTPQTIDTWKQKTVNLPLPSRVDVDLHAKMLESPKMTSDNTAEIVQEITLEGEKTNNRNYFCRVTIRQRPTDLQYLGELYLEEDTSSGASGSVTGVDGPNRSNGRSCQFMIGSKLSAQKYLQQFQDLYTEEGRKSVKICSFIPNSSSLTARVVSHPAQPSIPTTTQATAVTGLNSSSCNADQQSRTFVSSGSGTSSAGTNGPSATVAGVTSASLSLSSSSLISQTQHSIVQTTPSLSAMRTYGQKLALFQQQQQQQQQQASASSSTQYITVSSPSVSVAASTKTGSGGATIATQYLSTVQSSSHSASNKTVSSSAGGKTTPNTIGRQHSVPDMSPQIQSPTSVTPPVTPYPGVVSGTYVQSVVGSGGVNVTVPPGVTVTVAGNTPIVPASNSASMTPTSLSAQFIAAGLKTAPQPIQPAPPLALLQPQQGQLAQGRQGNTTFTIPTNFVPINQIPSIGVAAIGAQIQPKASPQSTPTCQPMPILPNTPLSPPSGTMTTVTLARTILPQQHQQQQQTRKISPANRTSQNLQPLVPIGSQLPPQQQFQVRMVQFSQQQPRQAQIQPQQQAVVQTQIPTQTIQIQGQPAVQVIQSQVAQGTQTKQTVQTRSTQQVQAPQTNSKSQGKSLAQRRRSQSKST